MKLLAPRRKQASYLVAAGILLTALTPAIQAATQPSEPIKIGFITSLSGVGADPSRDMVNGIQLYLDQAHHKIAGRNVELFVENDESNPAMAATKVRKLVEQDKVDVLDGLLLANIGYQVAPIVEKYRVPMIYCTAAADDLTQRKHVKYILRTSYSSSQATQPFGEWVYKTLGYKKVVTIGMDYPFGYEVVGGFQKSFEDAGGKVVQKLWAPLGFRDFKEVLSKVHPDADAVFLCTTSAAAEILPKQYKQMGIKLPIIAGGTSFDEAILPHLGDDAVGAVSAMNYSAALDNPANKKFVQAYRAKYHTDPSSYAEEGYTTGMWITRAVESLKGDLSDKEKLLTALKGVELKDCPRGPLKLDDHNNPIQNIYVRRVEKKDGKLQNTVIATFKDVSQFWKWEPTEYMNRPAYSRENPVCKNCQ